MNPNSTLIHNTVGPIQFQPFAISRKLSLQYNFVWSPLYWQQTRVTPITLSSSNPFFLLLVFGIHILHTICGLVCTIRNYTMYQREYRVKGENYWGQWVWTLNRGKRKRITVIPFCSSVDTTIRYVTLPNYDFNIFFFKVWKRVSIRTSLFPIGFFPFSRQFPDVFDTLCNERSPHRLFLGGRGREGGTKIVKARKTQAFCHDGMRRMG